MDFDLPTRLPRRTVLLAAACLPFARASAATLPDAQALQTAYSHLAALEASMGGRLGVAVLDTASGARIAHRADERFAMCSTFKFLAAAAVLKRVDDGAFKLDQPVTYGAGDLLSYAPVTKAHVAEGAMSLGALCAAAIEWSDNTAANLMLRETGGPAGVTRYIRTLGDAITRLDRNEPTVNTAIPGDPRDTTTPNAMLADLQAILISTALTPASRQHLTDWMIACKTGEKRLRAGLPATWRAGDKTGTGDNASVNTIAILWPPERAPLLAAVYCTGSALPTKDIEAVHAEVGRLIAATL